MDHSKKLSMTVFTSVAIAFVAAGCGSQVIGAAAESPAPSPTPTVSIVNSPAPAPTPTASEVPLDDVLVVKDANHVAMPLDPYMTPMTDILAIDVAKDVAAAKCMKTLGFSDWSAGIIRSWNPENYQEHDLFEFTSVETAASMGYGRPTAAIPTSGLALPKVVKRGPTDEELAAYDGKGTTTKAKSGKTIPSGGCFNEGTTKIFKDAKLSADPRELEAAAQSSALNHSRVREAVADWSDCMRQAGLPYSTPVLSKKDMRWAGRDSSTPASAEELQVATADARCQQKVNLVGIYLTAKKAYQKKLVDEHGGELTASVKVFRGWVANAKAMTAGYTD